MIDFAAAERLALKFIEDTGARSGDAFAMQPAKTVTRTDGWVFFYNSRQFIETGDPLQMLAGNGPIFVAKSGELTALPTHSPWEGALAPSEELPSHPADEKQG